jgi:hypothetical protein
MCIQLLSILKPSYQTFGRGWRTIRITTFPNSSQKQSISHRSISRYSFTPPYLLRNSPSNATARSAKGMVSPMRFGSKEGQTMTALGRSSVKPTKSSRTTVANDIISKASQCEVMYATQIYDFDLRRVLSGNKNAFNVCPWLDHVSPRSSLVYNIHITAYCGIYYG